MNLAPNQTLSWQSAPIQVNPSGYQDGLRAFKTEVMNAQAVTFLDNPAPSDFSYISGVAYQPTPTTDASLAAVLNGAVNDLFVTTGPPPASGFVGSILKDAGDAATAVVNAVGDVANGVGTFAKDPKAPFAFLGTLSTGFIAVAGIAAAYLAYQLGWIPGVGRAVAKRARK